MNFLDVLPYLSSVLAIGLTIGGVFALRSGYSKAAAEIQSGVIDALKEEVGALRRKVEDLEKDRSVQDRAMSTIRYALKQYGLRVIINGEYITLEDNTGKRKVTRIKDVDVDKDEDVN